MATACFHVFSGTGNSLHLARAVAAVLEARGHRTELREIGAGAAARGGRAGAAARGGAVTASAGGGERGPGDLDILVFPVYAMAMPRIVARYLRGLHAPAGPAAATAASGAPGARPRAAVLSTNGRIGLRFRDGHEGQALAEAERSLARGGWQVVLRETFDYPQNITSLIPAADEERRDAMVELMRPRIAEVAGELAGMMEDPGGAARGRRRPCSAPIQVIGTLFGWAFRLVGRRAWAMLFAADARCDGCGLCAARCPARAISMVAGRPAWSYACEACHRCMDICPREAIQASWLRLALMVTAWAATSSRPVEDLVRGALFFLPPPAAAILWLVLSVVLGLAVLRLLDLALVRLAALGSLRGALAFGWTRRFRRYRPPVD